MSSRRRGKQTRREQTQQRERTRHSWLVPAAAALLVLAGVIAYANSLHGPFVYDDIPAIRRNPSIQSLWPLGPVLVPPAGTTITHRPLLNLSLAVNYAVGGFDVLGYHLVNLSVHLLAALLLFGIVRRTLLLPRLAERWGSSATGLALGVALLWELHPLQTEAVSYVVQRAESLMGLFGLLSVYAAVRAVATARPAAWTALSCVGFGLAMGCKEAVIAAPVLVLVFDRLFIFDELRECFRRRWVLYAGLGAVGAIALALHLAGGLRTSTAWVDRPERWAYAAAQPGNILHYLRLSLWPSPLVFNYGNELTRDVTRIALACSGVALLGIGTLVALWRKHPAGFLGAWFFALLAPSSSVLPLNMVTVEHRIYLSLAAVIALLLGGGLWLWRRWVARAPGRAATGVARAAPIAALALLAVLLGAATHLRNRDYQDDVRLWQDTIRKRPRNPDAHVGLGSALADREDCAGAAAAFSTALGLGPTDRIKILAFVADAYLKCKQPAAALAACDQALGLGARMSILHGIRGGANRALAQPAQAVQDYGNAIALEPANGGLHLLRGVARVESGQRAEALADFDRSIELEPGNTSAYHHRGNLHFTSERFKEAVADFTRAMTNPGQRTALLRSRAFCYFKLGQLAGARADLESLRREGVTPDEALVRALAGPTR
jgi:protein O-mannosyl-transferase